MIRLALLRHGHTAWNRAHRIQGRTDIPLDADAAAKLRTLRLPAPWADAALYSSPLSRAVDTGALLTGRAPREEAALTEMDWGAWEGLRAADLAADPACDFRPIERWGWDWHPPGGKSPAALRDRLRPWANALGQDSLAISHIGVMRVLLALATGWNFERRAPFAIKRERLYIIEIENGSWRAQSDPLRLEVR